MIIASNNAEGGVNGAVPTNSDSGSGTSWSEVSVDTDKVKYSSSHTAHGSLSYEFAQSSSSGASLRLRWNNTITGTPTNMYGRFSMYTTGAPTASNKMAWGINTASVQAWGVNFNSTAKVNIKNTDDITLWNSTNRLPFNQWFRIEWHVISGSPGTMQVKIFHGLDYITPIEDSGPIAGNYGETFAMVFGPSNTSPAMPLCYMDDMTIADSAHGWIGPAGFPVANPQVGWGAGKAH